jgi:Leucine-rich repeat (LRR) protein
MFRQALCDKYLDPAQPLPEAFEDLRALRILSLPLFGIAEIGPLDDIPPACVERVSELDLNGNRLAWTAVSELSTKLPLPHLKTLSFSSNPLGNLCDSCIPWFSKLRVLVLDNTAIALADVRSVLVQAPELQELSLCQNGMRHLGEGVLTADTARQLRTLRLAFNAFADWASLDPISVLPSLTALNVSDNAIKCIPVLSSELVPASPDVAGVAPDGSGAVVRASPFSKLKALNLSRCPIDRWESIDALGKFPALRDLRIVDCPLPSPDAETTRLLAIARLPNVAAGGHGLQTVGSETAGLLNGSAISRMERRGARNFLCGFFWLARKHATPSM